MNQQHLLVGTNLPKYSLCTHETLLYIQQHPEAKAILHLAMRDGRNSLFTRNCPTRPEILRGSDILFRWCDAIKNLGVGKRAREKFRDEATASAVKNALQILVTELWCPMSASADQLRAAIHGGVRNGKGVLTSALKQARFVITEIRDDLSLPFDEARLSLPPKLIQLPELHSFTNYGKHEEMVTPIVPPATPTIVAPVKLEEMTSTDPITATLPSATATASLPPDFNSWSRLELGFHKELTPTSSSFGLLSPPLLTLLQQPAVPLTTYGPHPHPSPTPSAIPPLTSPRETYHKPLQSFSSNAMPMPFSHRPTLQEEEKDIATLLLQMKDQPPLPSSPRSRVASSPSLSVDFNPQRIQSHSRSSSFGGKFSHRHGSFGGGSVDTDLNETEDDDAGGEMDNKVNPHYVTCGSSPYHLLLESFTTDNNENHYFESFMSMMIHAGYATHLLSDPAHLDEWISKVIFLMNYELVAAPETSSSASSSSVLFHRQNLLPCPSNENLLFRLVSSSSPTSASGSHEMTLNTTATTTSLLSESNGSTSVSSLRICYGDYDANDILFPRAIALKILEKLRRCGEIKRRQGDDGWIANGDGSEESEWKETEKQEIPPATKRLKCQ
jgi:hypothetical protein